MMDSPRSAEEIRKIELNLEELVTKFQNRVQLIRDDLKSLVNEIELLKTHIGDLRRTSNEHTREISDLTNDQKALLNEVAEIEKEISVHESNLNSHNEKLSQSQSRLNTEQNQLTGLESEKASLSTILKTDKEELLNLRKKLDELQPLFESKIQKVQERCERLENDKDMLTYKFKAIRILSQSYLQTPEVNLIRFLANKPSPKSTMVEIRSALGIDSESLKTILQNLAERNVLNFDSAVDTIEINEKIDLFEMEV
jgi:chromosome segregation ATPase